MVRRTAALVTVNSMSLPLDRVDDRQRGRLHGPKDGGAGDGQFYEPAARPRRRASDAADSVIWRAAAYMMCQFYDPAGRRRRRALDAADSMIRRAAALVTVNSMSRPLGHDERRARPTPWPGVRRLW
jgi:hypothetical protein